MKKKSKVTKTLIAATFLITIISLVTTANAWGSNRTFVIAIGDDLDLPRTSNFIIGSIDGDGDIPSARVFFYSRIYDDSGEKVHKMIGTLRDGYLINTSFSFLCPIFNVWFINVWVIVGEGMFRTTDTDMEVLFRTLFQITLPNTEGQYVPATIFMWLNPTAEYYDADSEGNPTGPVKIWEKGPWAIAGVLWDIGIPLDVGFGVGIFPVGGVSSLTYINT